MKFIQNHTKFVPKQSWVRTKLKASHFLIFKDIIKGQLLGQYATGVETDKLSSVIDFTHITSTDLWTNGCGKIKWPPVENEIGPYSTQGNQLKMG